MTILAQSFPCLHPEVFPETECALNMKADVIRILSAALRGHPDLAPLLLDSGIGLVDVHGLPHALHMLMVLCCTVQLLAFLSRDGTSTRKFMYRGYPRSRLFANILSSDSGGTLLPNTLHLSPASRGMWAECSEHVWQIEKRFVGI